jgi:anti-sigma regulatory factor (Ser/Thr protein kinase)
MDSEGGSGALMPIGDFLTAEEPVWVWDAAERRILWANQAGRDFWGAASIDALRARPFNARSKAVQRMMLLASEPGQVREWVETLSLGAAKGRQPVKCHIQSLQVAGGHPGLIVRALDRREDGPDAEAEAPPPERMPRKRRSKSDRTAFDAIAAQLKGTPGSKKAGKAKSAIPATPPLELAPERLALTIQELSHELRNPLTVILGFAERIKDTAPPGRAHEKMRSYAAHVMESAELAMAILGDFSTRILRPDIDAPREEPADIRACVESCIGLIAPLAKQAGLKLSKSAGKGLPRLAAGERVLKQILLNLLMNAVRHQKTGGKVKVTARKRKDGSVRLTVADDGKGMTMKEIRGVMGASRRKTPPPPVPGRSGLGLPLVKRLVEAAGGTLAIESTRGKGTAVEMSFPAK